MYYIAQNSIEAIQYAQALRKKKIKETLDGLHTMQLGMIDEAVEQSDWSESKAVIDYIMEK